MESRGKEEKRQGTEEERHVADEELSLYDALCRMKNPVGTLPAKHHLAAK